LKLLEQLNQQTDRGITSPRLTYLGFTSGPLKIFSSSSRQTLPEIYWGFFEIGKGGGGVVFHDVNVDL
jgi:hypothetical protein